MGSVRRQDHRQVLRCRATEGSEFDLSDFVEGKVLEGESHDSGSAQIASYVL